MQRSLSATRASAATKVPHCSDEEHAPTGEYPAWVRTRFSGIMNNDNQHRVDAGHNSVRCARSSSNPNANIG